MLLGDPVLHIVLHKVYDVHYLYIGGIKLLCLKWEILKLYILGIAVDFYWLH